MHNSIPHLIRRERTAMHNGHEYVDLGLPSGTLWATCNVGADTETEYGNYYMYGKGATTYNSSDAAYTGTENPLSYTYDTARQVWGGSWHMQTSTQLQELIDNTTYTWETDFNGSGINGGKFTAANDNYIFITAEGFYYNGSLNMEGNGGCVWSSTPENLSYAYEFTFFDGYESVGENDCNRGFSVRAVIDAADL